LEEFDDEDREAVKRMFKLIIKVLEELYPKFQIILTDHADIQEEWFQNCIIEKWRGEKKLVPDTWDKDYSPNLK
jgi:hypothetical protein